MKKVLAVIAVVAVVCVAGSAFAQQVNRPHIDQRQGAQVVQGMPNPHIDQRQASQKFQPGNFGNCPCFDGRGPRQYDSRHDDRHERHGFTPDMPKEIRAKAAELAKLRVDLDEALSSQPVNKAKALDVHAKILELEKEIEAWRFAQRLDFMEKAKIQRELNKRITRPAPKLPVPALPVPAPKAEPEAEISAEAE